ncbi:MAG TPA: hypothetical protein VNW50_17395 [Streptosporangiaceae bacterium]|jgi:hypothetical protein|nr:hypothetical protein [Streptosporangiaceae bacterium]
MENASAAGTAKRRLVPALVVSVMGLMAAGCVSSGTGSAATPQQQSRAASVPASGATSAPTVAAAGTESPPPGDIPDSTVYLVYRPASGQYQVKVPEGWARTETPGAVSFTDKLNHIAITTVRAAAPTLTSARATEVPQIQGSARHFALAGISAVRRSAGSVILIRYSADSQPDPVTGKVYRDAVERYEFYRNGTEAIVTLSGPAGADNVDPWRIVTDSFRWLR